MKPSNYTFNGKKIVISIYISDVDLEVRSWMDRLFSWPWRPFKRTNEIAVSRIYQTPDYYIMSPKTFSDLMKNEEASRKMKISE